MEKSELTELTLEVDRMTRQLLAELKTSDLKPARLTKDTTAPTGSITIEPLMQARAARSKGRIVKFKGKGMEFEGSAEELRNGLESLDNRMGRK